MNPQARDKNGCSLAGQTLRSWGVLKLRATGLSMLPTLWPGDLLTRACTTRGHCALYEAGTLLYPPCLKQTPYKPDRNPDYPGRLHVQTRSAGSKR